MGKTKPVVTAKMEFHQRDKSKILTFFGVLELSVF